MSLYETGAKPFSSTNVTKETRCAKVVNGKGFIPKVNIHFGEGKGLFVLYLKKRLGELDGFEFQKKKNTI